METREYEVKLESVEENMIKVRFYSYFRVELWIKDIKLFYKKNSSDIPMVQYKKILLNNDFNILNIPYSASQWKEYSTLGMIVQDRTNRKQESIRIGLSDGIISYKSMLYERGE